MSLRLLLELYNMKYPLNTKIRYRPKSHYDSTGDEGKIGKIVGYEHGGTVARIVLPNSTIAQDIYGDSSHFFTTFMDNLEILPQKNEQLLFNFMNE